MNRLGCSTFSLKKAACQLWFMKESCAACVRVKSSRAYIRASGACAFMECLLPGFCLEAFDMYTMAFVGSRRFQPESSFARVKPSRFAFGSLTSRNS